MKVYTIANDSTNLGYTSTVKALAKIADFTYDEKKQHLKSTKDGKAFDETELENFITKISNSISNGEEVCVLFAGGTGWNSRITTIQKTLKNKFPYTYKKIKFILMELYVRTKDSICNRRQCVQTGCSIYRQCFIKQQKP